MEGTIRCRFLDVAAAVLYPQRQLIIGLAMMALPEGYSPDQAEHNDLQEGFVFL